MTRRVVDMTEEREKGCICWPDDDGVIRLPNAACRLHGILAGMLRPRDETGTYKIVPADPAADPGPPVDAPGWVDSEGRDAMEGPECPPGVHSLFDPCPGGCLNGEPTTEKEHGDLSTVRRWLRRLGDWLDPHAAAVRDYRAEWRRQRSDLDGGEPRDQGWQR